MLKLNSKIVATSLLGCALAAGCSNANKKNAKAQAVPPMSQAALHVPVAPVAPPAAPAPPPAPAETFTPTAPAQPVVYDPAAEQPVIDEPVVEASEPVAPPVARTRPPRKSIASSAATTGRTKYKVKRGDSLWSIAQAKYGNGNKWKAIAAANPKIDPNRVQAGQTITLP